MLPNNILILSDLFMNKENGYYIIYVAIPFINFCAEPKMI